MTVCLNIRNKDLAYRSGVSVYTVTRIFHKWIHVMYSRLNALIVWPSKLTVRRKLAAAKHASSVGTSDVMSLFLLLTAVIYP